MLEGRSEPFFFFSQRQHGTSGGHPESRPVSEQGVGGGGGGPHQAKDNLVSECHYLNAKLKV